MVNLLGHNNLPGVFLSKSSLIDSFLLVLVLWNKVLKNGHMIALTWEIIELWHHNSNAPFFTAISMKRKRENFPFAYLSNASFLQRHTLRLQIILCSGRLDFSTSKVCKKLEALVSHAFVTALMAFWDAPELMVFRYRETSVLLKSKSLLHFTGRRRAFDTHVCSGCVTKHPDIVPSLLGGPGALAEQKVLEASKLSADLYTLLGFVLIPAGVLTHSDKSAISWTGWHTKLIWVWQFLPQSGHHSLCGCLVWESNLLFSLFPLH